MKKLLKQYFLRLEELYLNTFNTKPASPYFDNCNLFVSTPDEEGYAEWLPIEIEHIDLENKEKLSKELIEFYSSYYYLNLSGEYKDIVFYFGNDMHTNETINKAIKAAIADGKYYFEDEEYILIGNACKDGNDDLLVFYDNKNEIVFLYDQDFNKKTEDIFKLEEIIKNLSPII